MTAEHRLEELGIALPAAPEPFGTYAEAVQTNNLLFLTGMLPTQGRGTAFTGRVGAELDVETGRKAARLAALNALAVARHHFGSLDRVTRIVRLGVMVATSAISRRSPTALQTCRRRCSERTRTRHAWSTASPASPLGRP
jgi:enamine deaminase RidA (YjgF/YER057c/UK114 family)